jgi:hypothetical protein
VFDVGRANGCNTRKISALTQTRNCTDKGPPFGDELLDETNPGDVTFAVQALTANGPSRQQDPVAGFPRTQKRGRRSSASRDFADPHPGDLICCFHDLHLSDSTNVNCGCSIISDHRRRC